MFIYSTLPLVQIFTALVQLLRRLETGTERVGFLLGHGRADDTITQGPSKHDPKGYTADGTTLREGEMASPFRSGASQPSKYGENTDPGLTWISCPVSTGCVGSGSLEPPYA